MDLVGKVDIRLLSRGMVDLVSFSFEAEPRNC